jgi:hypothetical protein
MTIVLDFWNTSDNVILLMFGTS